MLLSTFETPAQGLEPEVFLGLCRRLCETKRHGRAVRLVGIAVKVRRKALTRLQLELPF